MHREEVDNIGRRRGARRTNAGQLSDLSCESTGSVVIDRCETSTTGSVRGRSASTASSDTNGW